MCWYELLTFSFIAISLCSKKPQRPSSFSKNSDGQPWSSTDSSGYGTDCSSKSRGIPKANSFGGVPHNHQVKTPLKSQSLCKTGKCICDTVKALILTSCSIFRFPFFECLHLYFIDQVSIDLLSFSSPSDFSAREPNSHASYWNQSSVLNLLSTLHSMTSPPLQLLWF